jgi:hypothetical protein
LVEIDPELQNYDGTIINN